MCEIESVLNSHIQRYQNSCAASGMELVLKLHGLVELSFLDLQEKYRDTNIGFEKLADMAPYGILARDQETSIADGFSAISAEVQRGHFPLLSVYSDPVGWHIWVAVPDGDSFRLVSRAHGRPDPLRMDDLNAVRHNLEKYRSGKVHYVTYDTD